jgi:hypothetical protein
LPFRISDQRPGITKPAVCFLWHCPSGCLTAPLPACIPDLIGVTRHRALWCSDFPPPAHAGSDSPPFQNQSKFTAKQRVIKPRISLSPPPRGPYPGCNRGCARSCCTRPVPFQPGARLADALQTPPAPSHSERPPAGGLRHGSPEVCATRPGIRAVRTTINEKYFMIR